MVSAPTSSAFLYQLKLYPEKLLTSDLASDIIVHLTIFEAKCEMAVSSAVLTAR